MAAYKQVSRTGSAGDVSSAIETLQELGNECREIVDNSGEALANTQRIQTLESTADALENINDIDIPDCAAELTITYSEAVPTRKGRGASRAVRRDNAVAVLEAAKDAAQNRLDDKSDDTSEIGDDLQAFIDEIENVVGDAEGVEFPGMFG